MGHIVICNMHALKLTSSLLLAAALFAPVAFAEAEPDGSDSSGPMVATTELSSETKAALDAAAAKNLGTLLRNAVALARQLPDQAPAIAAYAASLMPQRAENIAAAVARVVPAGADLIVLAVSAVPAVNAGRVAEAVRLVLARRSTPTFSRFDTDLVSISSLPRSTSD
jgi:hypothetical protein